MSFNGISKADHTKGNKGDRQKLSYGPNGEPMEYTLRIVAMRGNEEPEPPVLPWVAADFEILESEHPSLPAGSEVGHSWTVGGQWGHLGFQDLKAFLAMVLELDSAAAAKIDRSVVIFAIGDDQPVADVMVKAIVTKKVRGKKSARPGEPFASVHFEAVGGDA